MPLEIPKISASDLSEHQLGGQHGSMELPSRTGLLTDPKFLAQGGFGTVAKCTLNTGESVSKDGQKASAVAVKRIAISNDGEDWEDTLRLLREVHFMQRLPHECVVPLTQFARTRCL